MNKSVVLGAFLAASIPHVALAQATLIRGDAALATFEHISADGCVHTVGELVLVDSSKGAELAEGLYITGSQEDVCLGTGNGFASYAPSEVQVLGLLYGRYRGTVVADSYSSGAPVTFDIDLTWAGRGNITRERNVWDDDGVVSFTFTARRDAKTYGALRANGEEMQITSATLVREASGTISH